MEEETKSFEDVKKELLKIHQDSKYKTEIIKRTLNEKKSLRKTYCALILSNPARFQNISDKTFNSRQAGYNHLWELKMLGLIDMIPIMDIWNQKNLNNIENSIIKKFKKWTDNMSDAQRQNFAGRTRYYILTDLGKDTEIVNWVLFLEKQERSSN